MVNLINVWLDLPSGKKPLLKIGNMEFTLNPVSKPEPEVQVKQGTDLDHAVEMLCTAHGIGPIDAIIGFAQRWASMESSFVYGMVHTPQGTEVGLGAWNKQSFAVLANSRFSSTAYWAKGPEEYMKALSGLQRESQKGIEHEALARMVLAYLDAATVSLTGLRLGQNYSPHIGFVAKYAHTIGESIFATVMKAKGVVPWTSLGTAISFAKKTGGWAKVPDRAERGVIKTYLVAYNTSQGTIDFAKQYEQLSVAGKAALVNSPA